MASAQGAKSHSHLEEEEGEDEDEWEYEYDENETEDFYVTVDLTTHIHKNDRKIFQGRQKEETISSQTRNARKPRGGKPGSRKHVKKPRQLFEDTVEDDEDESENDQDEEMQTPTQEHASATPAASADGRATPAKSVPTPSNAKKKQSINYMDSSDDPIQILELHSLNPLISYRGRVYSCEWASSIGTDMIFEAPTQRFPDPNVDHGELSEARLLATTRHRLVAKPAKLTPRKEEPQRPPIPIVQALGLQGVFDTPTTGESAVQEMPSGRDQAALNKKASITMQQRNVDQVDFLQRLSALRKAKGEDEFVPMHQSELLAPKARRGRPAGLSTRGRNKSTVAGHQEGVPAHRRVASSAFNGSGSTNDPFTELASDVDDQAKTERELQDPTAASSSSPHPSRLQAPVTPTMGLGQQESRVVSSRTQLDGGRREVNEEAVGQIDAMDVDKAATNENGAPAQSKNGQYQDDGNQTDVEIG